MTSEDVERIEALLRAYEDWERLHKYSSEYSDERADLSCALEEHASELLASWRRCRELEAALTDIVRHAEKNGMQEWTVIRRARAALEKK